MKQILKIALAIAFLVAIQSAAWGQTVPPGTITVNTATTITATAGSGTTAVACTFTNPNPPSTHVVCSFGGTQILTEDITPVVGQNPGNIVAFGSNPGGNAISWQLTQATAGSVSWLIAANGTSKSGTF